MLNHVEVVSFLHYCITTSKKSDALGVNTEALQSSGKRAEQRRRCSSILDSDKFTDSVEGCPVNHVLNHVKPIDQATVNSPHIFIHFLV